MIFFKQHWRKFAILDVVAVILVGYLSFVGIEIPSLFYNDGACTFCSSPSDTPITDGLSSIHSQVSMQNPFPTTGLDSSGSPGCGCQEGR